MNELPICEREPSRGAWVEVGAVPWRHWAWAQDLRELEIEYMAAMWKMLREEGLLTKEAWEKANVL